MAFSNRTGLVLGKQTSLRVVRFQQKPVQRTLAMDSGFEPSRSEVELRLEHGLLAMHRATPNPRSTFVIHTPLGSVYPQGTNWAVVVTGSDCHVWTFDSEAVVQLEGHKGTLLMNRNRLLSLAEARLKGQGTQRPFEALRFPDVERAIKFAKQTLITTHFDYSEPDQLKARTLVPVKIKPPALANSHRFDRFDR
jgi:hypothetical protein